MHSTRPMKRTRFATVHIYAAIAVFATIPACRGADDNAAPVLDPFPESDQRIIALGDSYTSGEGARRFFAGTNVFRVNECRRTWTAYPWIVARRLERGLTFAACSGAVVDDVLTKGQYPSSPEDVLGGRPQLEVLKSDDADIVLVGIGGNDAGFSAIGKTCVFADCLTNADRWLDNLSLVRRRVTETLRAVREVATKATIFAVTYPNPLGERNCLPSLSAGEWDFVRNRFLPALNGAVKDAARTAGVNVIDVQDAFEGYRICEVDADAGAMNIIGLGRVEGMGLSLSKLNHNTLHPNARGHRLTANIVREAVARTTGNPDPVVVGGGAFGAPPIEEAPAEPVGVFIFPQDAPCAGERIDYVFDAAVDDADGFKYHVTQAAPSSTVCFREAGGTWQTATTDTSGSAALRLRVTEDGATQVLYVDALRRWTSVNFTST